MVVRNEEVKQEGGGEKVSCRGGSRRDRKTSTFRENEQMKSWDNVLFFLYISVCLSHTHTLFRLLFEKVLE